MNLTERITPTREPLEKGVNVHFPIHLRKHTQTHKLSNISRVTQQLRLSIS